MTGEPARAELRDPAFARAVAQGLSEPQKTLPCRYLYDARGSDLFEDITRLDAYYPTRAERSILEERAGGIAARTPAGALLVEFGSGSSLKTEVLLAAMQNLGAYLAIDVSASALEEARLRLAQRFPHLRVIPVIGDFRAAVDPPRDLATAPRLGFFPGSTIGNLTRPEAGDLLAHFARALGSGARLVIGVDLKKNVETLVRAYDDPEGVTSAFNKNLLVRINRELGGDFDLDAFDHQAVYDEAEGRIEMRLVSARAQIARVEGRDYAFRPGEYIHTENSYKYSLEEFSALAMSAGWRSLHQWRDRDRCFSLHELEAV